MVFREVSVIEIGEALRAWLAGKSERAVAAQAGVDRKTSRRYVTAAVAAGLSREGGEEQLTDELIGQVVSVVRPVRPDGHGAGWAELEARHEEIAAWVKGEVPVVKIGILLGRRGVVVAERTLHRFAAERCGAGGKVTTRVDDGPPGGELQVDFGDLGLIPAGEGRRRKLRALVFTACFSRYMFVYLTFSMTLEEVIAGCEDAWGFFGGVFRVVVPDYVPRNIIPDHDDRGVQVTVRGGDQGGVVCLGHGPAGARAPARTRPQNRSTPRSAPLISPGPSPRSAAPPGDLGLIALRGPVHRDLRGEPQPVQQVGRTAQLCRTPRTGGRSAR
jgi:hypothetical protein